MDTFPNFFFQYITLVELKNQYQEKKDELEDKAIAILQKCYESNYDRCLLLIRWKHVLWGNRTALELGELAEVQKFMAHQAVQDLLDKAEDHINLGFIGLCEVYSFESKPSINC